VSGPPAAAKIDLERLPRLRAAAQLFHRPASITDPIEVARAVAGVQAQDPYAARLSFRSRSRRLTADDVDRARSEERSLLRTWLMRMTIHIIPTEDAGWMLPLFEPRMERWSRRRLDQLGMPVERALTVAKETLDREGPVSRVEMRDRILEAGIELDSQTRHHIIGLTVLSGIACLGPDRGRTPLLVRREDWLGKLPRYDHEAALAELARRYLRGFGPADARDLAYWSGLPLGEVRRGLERIAAELEEVDVGGRPLFGLKGARPRLPRAGQVRMLGAFDTYLLGYASRDFAVAPKHRAAVKAAAGGGWIHPVIVHDGVVVGGWRYSRRNGKVEIALDRSAVPGEARDAVDAEVADISRFEGSPATLTLE
jgi:Winged helix DNA-binding domain